MLVKATELIKKNVVTLDQGKKIEDVNDVIYDPVSNKIKAFLVDPGGWFKDAKVVLFEDVKNVGKDALMVESADVLKKASEVSEDVANIAEDKTYLTKTKIITEDGTELGHVSDLLFDSETGVVSELEVSRGLKNLQSGKKRVLIGDIVKIGKDATIVKSYTEEEFEMQDKEMMTDAKDKVQGTLDLTKHKAQELMTQTKEKLSEAGEMAKEKFEEMKNSPEAQNAMDVVKQKTSKVKESIADARKKSAVGKYLTVNVLSPSDEMLAKRGDVITNDLLSRAEELNLLDKVLGNTSEKPVSA
jgi:uncharacterized protein YrrD